MSENEGLSSAPEELLWTWLGEAEGLARADLLIELGTRSADLGEVSRAVALLDEAAGVAEQVEDLRLAASALFRQGGLRFGMAEYQASASAYLRSAEHYRSTGRQADQARALWGQADALRADGDFAGAVKAAVGARSLAEAEGLPQLAGDASFILARALYYLDLEDEALTACVAGRDHFRTLGDTHKVAQIDDFALTIHLFLGHLDDALKLARNCHVLALTTPSPSDDAYATRRLADVHLRRGEYDAALERAVEARRLYRDQDFLLGVARSDVIRARVLRVQGALVEALEVFTDARVLYDSVGADEEALNCDTPRAVLLYALGQYREAAAINRHLIDALGDRPDPHDTDLPWAVVRLAEAHLAANEAAAAVDLLSAWMKLWERADEAARASNRYALEVAACALAELDLMEEAAETAGAALGLTTEEEVNARTAEMYEFRARWWLESDDDRGRQELAHAIALHLAFGSTDRATELSSFFMPDVRRTGEMESERTWEADEARDPVAEAAST